MRDRTELVRTCRQQDSGKHPLGRDSSLLREGADEIRRQQGGGAVQGADQNNLKLIEHSTK